MRKFVYKPWGWYITLEEQKDFKVKRITLHPHQRFSLQYHDHREEHWTVVDGSGEIIVGDSTSQAAVGSRWIIPTQVIHRATAGKEGLTFIETQIGECDENDIVRLEDDYNRVTSNK